MKKRTFLAICIVAVLALAGFYILILLNVFPSRIINSGWIGFAGSVAAGLLTFGGVYLSLSYNERRWNDDKKMNIAPLLIWDSQYKGDAYTEILPSDYNDIIFDEKQIVNERVSFEIPLFLENCGLGALKNMEIANAHFLWSRNNEIKRAERVYSIGKDKSLMLPLRITHSFLIHDFDSWMNERKKIVSEEFDENGMVFINIAMRVELDYEDILGYKHRQEIGIDLYAKKINNSSINFTFGGAYLPSPIDLLYD